MKAFSIWSCVYVGAENDHPPALFGSSRKELVDKIAELGLELNRVKDEFGSKKEIEKSGNFEWVGVYTNTIKRVILYTDTKDLVSKVLNDDFLSRHCIQKVEGKYIPAGHKELGVA